MSVNLYPSPQSLLEVIANSLRLVELIRSHLPTTPQTVSPVNLNKVPGQDVYFEVWRAAFQAIHAAEEARCPEERQGPNGPFLNDCFGWHRLVITELAFVREGLEAVLNHYGWTSMIGAQTVGLYSDKDEGLAGSEVTFWIDPQTPPIPMQLLNDLKHRAITIRREVERAITEDNSAEVSSALSMIGREVSAHLLPIREALSSFHKKFVPLVEALRRHVTIPQELRNVIAESLGKRLTLPPEFSAEIVCMLEQAREVMASYPMPEALKRIADRGPITDEHLFAYLAHTCGYTPKDYRGLTDKQIHTLVKAGACLDNTAAAVVLESCPSNYQHASLEDILKIDLTSCTANLDDRLFEQIDSDALRGLDALRSAQIAGETPISKAKLRRNYLHSCNYDRTLTRWLEKLPDVLKSLIVGKTGSGMRLVLPFSSQT